MKKVIITGGSRGIGKALVEIFVKNNWEVATCSVQTGHLKDSLAHITAQCDVSSSQQVKGFVEKVIQKFGKIDALINNAGLSGGNSLSPQDDDETWHQILNVNLSGTYYMCKYFSPYFPAGEGRIVNIASILALKGVPDSTAYCASKHGVLGLTRALAQDFASRKITVNAVCPGWVRTDMAMNRIKEIGLSEEKLHKSVPLGRMVEANEVADFVFYLASSAGGSMISGQALTIDGGTLS